MKGAKGDATKVFESSIVSVMKHFDQKSFVEDFILIHGSTERVTVTRHGRGDPELRDHMLTTQRK